MGLKIWFVLGRQASCMTSTYMLEKKAQFILKMEVNFGNLQKLWQTCPRHYLQLLATSFSLTTVLAPLNWWLMINLNQQDISACGTLSAHRFKIVSWKNNKELKRAGRGSLDCSCDLNSGTINVRWFDNGSIHLVSHFVGVEPMSTVEIQCPQIVKTYNGMGGVDFSDMFISLNHIVVKTRRWYIKEYWHCIDICKINARILYCPHCLEQGITKSLLKFSPESAESLMLANKAACFLNSTGKPSQLESKPAKPCRNSAIRKDQFLIIRQCSKTTIISKV